MLNDACLNIGANAMRSAMSWFSLHTAIPNAAGSNESIADRRPSAWAAPTNGDLVSASINFTGGEPSGPVAAVGFWNADAAGAFYGYYPVVGDLVFNGAGDYTLAAFTLAGSSS